MDKEHIKVKVVPVLNLAPCHEMYLLLN